VIDRSMRATDRAYLCLGIGWRTGVPSLDVVDVALVQAEHIPLMQGFLGFRATSSRYYCTGRYGFFLETDTMLVPCPSNAVAVKSGQCVDCATRDELRFAHHYHTGGRVSMALAHYMSQPHWVYIATFADGSSKVGTATDVRKRSRLDEQGAVIASYIARTADGKLARYVEDSVTIKLGITQRKTRSAKLAALARPLSQSAIESAHSAVLDRVAPLVGSYAQESSSITALRDPWLPTPGVKAIITNPPAGGWPVYPHDLSTSEHGLSVLACCGQAALVQAKSSDEPYLVDLGKLRGIRFTFGEFSSPSTAVQSTLF